MPGDVVFVEDRVRDVRALRGLRRAHRRRAARPMAPTSPRSRACWRASVPLFILNSVSTTPRDPACTAVNPRAGAGDAPRFHDLEDDIYGDCRTGMHRSYDGRHAARDLRGRLLEDPGGKPARGDLRRRIRAALAEELRDIKALTGLPSI